MTNLTAFTGTFLAYLIVFLVFVAGAGLAIFIGITVRKSKNKKAEALKTQEE